MTLVRTGGEMWLASYGRVLAVACVLVFYSNLAFYLFVSGHSPIPPSAIVIAAGVMALPLTLLPGRTWRTLASPLGVWGGLALTVAFLGFVRAPSPGTVVGDLLGITSGIGFLLLLHFILDEEGAATAARSTLVACVLFGVAVNIYDLTHPLTFSPILGRAAGMYINPNISAFALVLGLSAGLERFGHTGRIWYVGVVGVGIAATGSRAGALLWVLTVLIALVQGRVRVGRLILASVPLAFAAVVGITILARGDPVAVASVVSDLTPLHRMTEAITEQDASSLTRVDVARAAMGLLGEHPILGAGLGASSHWEFSQQAHNMYLRLGAEMGLLGVGVFLGMAVAIVLSAQKGQRLVVVRFAVLWLVAGLFSHSLLEERPELLVVALITAIARGDASGSMAEIT